MQLVTFSKQPATQPIHPAQAATLTAAQKGDPPMRERERTLLESERDRFEDMLRGITVGEVSTLQEGMRADGTIKMHYTSLWGQNTLRISSNGFF